MLSIYQNSNPMACFWMSYWTSVQNLTPIFRQLGVCLLFYFCTTPNFALLLLWTSLLHFIFRQFLLCQYLNIVIPWVSPLALFSPHSTPFPNVISSAPWCRQLLMIFRSVSLSTAWISNMYWHIVQSVVIVTWVSCRSFKLTRSQLNSLFCYPNLPLLHIISCHHPLSSCQSQNL